MRHCARHSSEGTAKALSTYMGHASVTITLDRYGHLMPGNEEQAASLLDAYIAANVHLHPISPPSLPAYWLAQRTY